MGGLFILGTAAFCCLHSPPSSGVVVSSSNSSFTVQRTLKLHNTVPQVSRILQNLQRTAASITSKHSISKMTQDPQKAAEMRIHKKPCFRGMRRLHPAFRCRDWAFPEEIHPTGLQQHGNNNTPIFQFQQQHWKTLSLPKLIHVSMWGGGKVILTHLVPASCFSQLLWISKFKCYNWSWVKNRISVMWETDILACFYTESEQKKNLKSLMKGQSKKIQFWTHPYWYI